MHGWVIVGHFGENNEHIGKQTRDDAWGSGVLLLLVVNGLCVWPGLVFCNVVVWNGRPVQNKEGKETKVI